MTFGGLTLRDLFARYGIAFGLLGTLAVSSAIVTGTSAEQTASGIVQGDGSTLTDGTDGSIGPTLDGDTSGVTRDVTTGGGPVGGQTTDGGGPVGGGPTSPAGGSTNKLPPAPGTHTGSLTDKPGVIFGKGLCRSDGRQQGISKYSPPCATWVGGNGGATARGVTANSIKVVRWLGQVDDATNAILKANKLADDPTIEHNSFQALFTYANQHLMTYGRKVEMVDYPAGGPSDNDAAMRSDAIKIAKDLKAFAVIVGKPAAQAPDKLADELAAQGVVCICTVSPTSKFYTSRRPYIFGPGLPPGTLYAGHIGEYVGKRLKSGVAKWAGDPLLRNQKRRFGLIWVSGANGRADPEASRVKDELVAGLKSNGVGYCPNLAASGCLAKDAVVGYLADPGRNQNDIDNIIAQMKAQHVTTVIMWVDPLFGIYFTPQATQKGFFPEWFITGSGLSDTTAAGRLYDQTQWTHAFGISPLSVLWQDVHKSGGWRAAHHGDPSMKDGDEGALVNIYAAYVGNLFLGIHMAGPILTPDSYAQGMFKYPKTGGSAAFPLVYFTRALPSAGKDFTEIWYDVQASGNDERGNPGPGMMRHVNYGKRYQLGQWPSSEPKAFVRDDAAIINTDNPPGGGDLPHEQDGHKHSGACLSCPDFKTTK